MNPLAGVNIAQIEMQDDAMLRSIFQAEPNFAYEHATALASRLAQDSSSFNCLPIIDFLIRVYDVDPRNVPGLHRKREEARLANMMNNQLL